MSQSDSFIDEVTEEVRRDKLFARMRKYGWIAVLAVIVIVGGATWYEIRQSRETAEAEALGDALLTALEQGVPAERATALDAVATESPGAAAVRDFMRAAELTQGGGEAAAADLYRRIAADGELPLIYRSLASFRLLALTGDEMEPAALRSAYEDLAAPGAPLRLMALEQVAMTYVAEDNVEEALTRLQALLDEAGATPDLLRRVSQMIVVLGGTPDIAEEQAGAAETTE